MIQLFTPPQRQLQHFIAEPDGIVKTSQCLAPKRLTQHVAGIAATTIHTESEPQILTGNGKPVGRLAKLGHVVGLGPIGKLDILCQIQNGTAAHRLAKVAGGDLRQLMGFIKHIDLSFRYQLAKSGVFHCHIGEEEVMVDHHHLGVHGAATGYHQMTVVVIGAIATEAVFIGAGDVSQDLGILLQPRNIPHVAIVGGGGPGLHLHQIIEHFRLLQMGFAQEPVHPLDAEIVAAPLEQGHRRGIGERACDGREIPIEELLLQVFGAGADHDPFAGLQRRHQIGVSLAGTGPRLHQQATMALDGAGDRLGHLQLGSASFETVDMAGQRAIWLEQGLDGQRGVPRSKRPLCQKCGKSGTDSAPRRRDRSGGRDPACDHSLPPSADHVWLACYKPARAAGSHCCQCWSCAADASC